MKQKTSSQLYVCLISNGLIKVGRSLLNAKSRLKSHAATARLMGETVEKFIIYDCATSSNKHESVLIRKCVNSGGVQVSKEWFKGISFEQVDELAKECAEMVFEVKEINLDKINSLITSIEHVDYEWIIALRHASLIQGIFSENGIWLDVFEYIEDKNVSLFEIFCAIYMYKNDDISVLYKEAHIAAESDNQSDWVKYIFDLIQKGKSVNLCE